MSTTNANMGNIKLSKFTCHSTRNTTKQPNMFKNSNNPKSDKDGAEKNNDDTAQHGTSSAATNYDGMPLQPAHKIIIPNHESTKHSLKRNGVVRAYAANTN